MDELIRIFIGYDPRETVAFHVLSHSIHVRASHPVSITPIMLTQLHDQFCRDWDPKQSTEFSFARFMVPSLIDFRGWALFMDCDMLMLDDVAKLWAMRDDRYAVQVVKHDHTPTETKKFLGSPQTKYEKKNWSSVMLLNGARCTALTPDLVCTASGLHLHRFEWLDNDDLIGTIPHRWNHLVGYDPDLSVEEISNLHFTVGGPYFDKFRDCAYAELWFAEREKMLHAVRF